MFKKEKMYKKKCKTVEPLYTAIFGTQTNGCVTGLAV